MWADGWMATTIYNQSLILQLFLIFALLVGAYLLGAFLRRLLVREPCGETETALVGSAIALLAFVIGFTFSIALNRYDERRNLVLAEANAIGTAWLRVQVVPEPLRSEMQQTLVRYADARIAIFDAGENLDRLRELQQASQLQLDLLWQQTLEAVKLVQPAPLGSLLMQTVNETIDLAEARRTTFLTRLPRVVLVLLLGFAVVSAGLSGFTRGGRRHFVIGSFVWLMLALAITLIIDLDRPLAGTVRLTPGPLAMTRAAMALPSPTAAEADSSGTGNLPMPSP